MLQSPDYYMEIVMPSVFNPSVFDSYENLQGFFNSSDAVDKVLSRNGKPTSKVFYPINPNLRGIWCVAQLATAPFRWIAAVALSAIALISSCLGAKSFKKQAKMASRRLDAGFSLHSDNPTKLFLLQKTENHANDRGIVGKAQPIPGDQIQDPRVRNRTFLRMNNQVNFRDSGICKGISNWFIYLYLKTQHQFSDPRSHMIALGKQFSKGGGIEPTLLHSLYVRNGKLLNMRIGEQQGRVSGQAGRPVCSHTLSDWKDAEDQVLSELKNLPAGAYSLIVPFHQMAYVKIDAHLGFLLDPNEGIIEISGKEVEEELYAFVLLAAQECLEGNALDYMFYRLSRVRITKESKLHEVFSQLYEIFSHLDPFGIQFRPYHMREPV